MNEKLFIFNKLRKSGMNIAVIEMCADYFLKYEQLRISENELKFLESMNKTYKLNLNLKKKDE